jgi:hypothetical protein
MAQAPRVVDPIEAAIQARSPSDAQTAHALLFPTASEHDIQRWKMHRHPGIALRGEWERGRRRLTQRTESVPESSAVSLNRFAAFVEGRLFVAPPKWWEEMLLSAEIVDRKRFYFRAPKEPPYKRDWGVFVPHAIALRKTDAGFLATVQDQKVAIQRRLIDEAERTGGADAIVVRFNDDWSFVAVHSTREGPYYIHCLGRTSGEVLWSAKVWAAGGLVVPQGGPGYHYVDLIIKDDALYGYGGSSDAIYIEGLSIKTGQSKFRFSTSY